VTLANFVNTGHVVQTAAPLERNIGREVVEATADVALHREVPRMKCGRTARL